MMTFLKQKDKNEILRLAEQVEHLFGKMAGNPDFENAVTQCLLHNCVIGAKENDEVLGAVVIDNIRNEITWLVVDKKARGKGIGHLLLKNAIDSLDRTKEITVETFDRSAEEGAAARALYEKHGFTDYQNGGRNPAGIPTVVMKRL
jgi:ribosomal protein S18 acetylase RimI-like enzyme